MYTINKILFIVFFLAYLFSNCTTEKNIYKDVPFNRITLIKSDTLIQFYTKPPREQLSGTISSTNYYTWYRGDSIHVTQGAYNGKLLHGEYLELYPNRALKQKGKFKEGLKHGTWQSWFENGERESMIGWENGLKHGNVEFYTSDGKMQRFTYKEGKIVSDSVINKK